MSSKTTETASSRPAWQHPEREHIEKRLATIETEGEALRSRRDAYTERITEISDRVLVLAREEPKDYRHIAALQREQFEFQNDQMAVSSRLGLLEMERDGKLQALRNIEEIEARRQGIAQ